MKESKHKYIHIQDIIRLIEIKHKRLQELYFKFCSDKENKCVLKKMYLLEF